MRCAWCKRKHLIDGEGYPIKGNAEIRGKEYSDGMCRKAEKIEIDRPRNGRGKDFRWVVA